MSVTQARLGHGKPARQHVGGNRQRMLRTRRRLELALLLAAQPQLCANSFDAMHARPDAVLCQIRLQTFRTIGLACAPMRSLDLDFQSGIFFCARRRRALVPGVKPTHSGV